MGLEACNPESVTIKDGTTCAIAGKLSAGMNCTHLLSDSTAKIDFNHAIDFLEARQDRPDPDHAGGALPAHGAAICMPSADWAQMISELQQLCRIMGKSCTYEMKAKIESLKSHMPPNGEPALEQLEIAPEAEQ